MGLDIDYLDKLSDEELAWYVDFVKRYYGGQSSDLEERQDCNRRSYLAKQADAMSLSVSIDDLEAPKNISNPEEILILLEDYRKSLQPKPTRRRRRRRLRRQK